MAAASHTDPYVFLRNGAKRTVPVTVLQIPTSAMSLSYSTLQGLCSGVLSNPRDTIKAVNWRDMMCEVQ
jgi:hypothetical protein